MASIPHHSFFRRFVAPREPAPTQIDPADLGTAFGLEASLGPADASDSEDDAPGGAPRSEHAPMDWLTRPKRRKR